jgi:hypothetical protein
MPTQIAGGVTATRAAIRPRPVFCVTGHAYRNLAVAEAVAAGRFTHAGLTLTLGVEPDWLTADGLPADEEWRIEWSKFYYGLDLAYAFRRTGDAKFVRAWERLVLSWLRQVPVGFDSSDVTGRRVLNWIYAWDAFASAACFDRFDDGFDERLFAGIAAQVKHLRAHLTAERNHRTLELYALFVAALALPSLDAPGSRPHVANESPANESLLDFAVAELYQNLLTDIRPDGVQRENSTHYHMLVLRSFLGVCENARRFRLTLPRGFAARVERACEFAMHCRRPDGLIPALSDSDTGDYADILELAADLFARPDFLYAATAGERGTPPRRRNAGFPDGGYFIQRSDWGEAGAGFRDARFLVFDCGPLGDGGHGHYDLLNVEIAAAGRALVLDPGRYTYSEHGAVNWRRRFKGTAAHNTVCVDRLDQTPYRCGKPKGPTAQGRLLERLSAPTLDLLAGEADSPVYEVRHTRRVLFVANEYWLICDELRGSVPHHYDLRFHLAPEALNRTRIVCDGANPHVRAPGLSLVFEPSRRPREETGWVAPRYGVKLPAPVISIVSEGAAEARFFTLVVPCERESAFPAFLTHVKRSGATETIIAEVAGVGDDGAATDRLVWSTTPQTFELGAFQGRASAAWLRASADGEALSFAACNVLDLKRASGETAFHLTKTVPARWVTWSERAGMVCDERAATARDEGVGTARVEGDER